MTAETAPGQAGAPGGSAEPRPAPPGPPQRMEGIVRYGIWVAVVIRALGDRRFQVSVVTGAIGAYALFSLIKNNQAQPMRRVVRWYNVKGEIRGARLHHRARRAVEPGKRQGAP